MEAAEIRVKMLLPKVEKILRKSESQRDLNVNYSEITY